jgi:Flp pilus assembly protein TadD
VLKLDPSDADAAYQAGSLQFRSGKMEEALALFSISKELRPHHAPTLRMRAMTLQNLARLNEAATEMAGAYALDSANAEICNRMGVLLRKLGRREEALPIRRSCCSRILRSHGTTGLFRFRACIASMRRSRSMLS